MVHEHNGQEGLVHVHAEKLLPLVVIVLSVSYALLSVVMRPEPEIPVVLGPQSYDTNEQYFFVAESDPVVALTPAPVPLSDIREEWILSPEPSSLYVIQEIGMHSCPETQCEVVHQLYPGVYWDLPYTLSAKGWFETAVSGTDVTGFVSVADVSPTYPERCRLSQPYRIDHMSSRFLNAGFDRARLMGFVLEAEEQVEEAIGRDILTYDETAQNTVNFVISHYRDNEPFHRGLHTSDAVFPNGAVGQFWIGVYGALFDDVDDWVRNRYISSRDRDTFTENYIRKTILHELVHTVGFGHTNDPTGIMCGEPDCRPAAVDFSSQQLLNSLDIDVIRRWCG